MKKIVVILVLLLLICGYTQSLAQAEPSEEDWPPDADNIVAALILISEKITPTTPPDISRQVRYDGIEQIEGVDCYIFIVYTELAERYENLGIYAKAKDTEEYYFFDAVEAQYRRVIVGDKAIFLEGDTPDAAKSPSIAMTEQIYDGDFIIEIPSFKSEEDSAVLQELNDAIANFSAPALETYSNRDDIYWSELRAYPFASDAHVQIVMTRIEYPIYGTDGEIISFNYEVNSGAVMTLEDAISAHRLDTANLTTELAESGLLSEYQSVGQLKISAFRIMDDGNVDFYVNALIKNSEAEDWDMIFTYHTLDKSFDDFEKFKEANQAASSVHEEKITETIISCFEEQANHNFAIFFPVNIEGEDCYKVAVNGRLADNDKTYPIDIFAVNLNNGNQYFYNKETEDYERFYTTPTFACKTSPDGKLRIESVGMYLDGPSGLHSLKEMRIIDTANGDVLWSGDSFLTNEYIWSTDSRFVAATYSGRRWTETYIVDTKGYDVIQLPYIKDVQSASPGVPEPDENVPMPVFKAVKWISPTNILIHFEWTGGDGSDVSGEYTYDVVNKKMSIKSVAQNGIGE